jgi:hypothetical protein
MDDNATPPLPPELAGLGPREGPPTLYRLIPGGHGRSREQSREHRGSGPVWSRTPSALRSSATETDRLAGHGKADPGVESNSRVLVGHL